MIVKHGSLRNTRVIQKVKNLSAYSPRTCFVAADHWFPVFSIMLKSCLTQLHVGPSHVVSAEIAVAIIPYSPDLAQSDFFLFPKSKEHLAGKRFEYDEDLKNAGLITRRPHGIKRVHTNWCQGTSVLMSKVTMWKGRQRYVPKFVYSVSVLLLLKNILVWRNGFYLMDDLHILGVSCPAYERLDFTYDPSRVLSSSIGIGQCRNFWSFPRDSPVSQCHSTFQSPIPHVISYSYLFVSCHLLSHSWLRT